MLDDQIKETVNRLDKAVFGDRDDIRKNPGVIAEQVRMSTTLDRTNEILTELRNAVIWIIRLIVGGFATALLALVYKGIH